MAQTKKVNFMAGSPEKQGDAQKLLSATIAEAAASAAVAAVQSIFSDNNGALYQEQKQPQERKKTSGKLKFTNKELDAMSVKLKNYFICRNKIVTYRFHKGVYEVNYRRDGIKLYVAATDLATLKARFVERMELLFAQNPNLPTKHNTPVVQQIFYYPQPMPMPQQQGYVPAPALPTYQQPMPVQPQQQSTLYGVLFTDYVAQWLALKKPTVKPRTYQEYERIAKYHFEKDFAGIPLKEMTRARIQDYLFRLVNEGKYRTAEKLHLAFTCIFELATEDLGFVSPMKKIELPYHESKKGSALTKAEEKQLVDYCLSHKENAASDALLVMLYFGLRRSELATIRVEDNFLICTTSKQRQGRVEVDRKIPFTPVFRRVLPYVDFQKAKEVKLNTIQSTFKRLLPEHHPHELRYTFITRCKEAGCNLEAVMLWAGHSFDKDVKTSAVDRGYTDYSDEYLLSEAQKVDYPL